MTEEFIRAKEHVMKNGCRVCPACDVVPNIKDLHDLYCELLSTPGQINEPVVRDVPPGVFAPLPTRCPYFHNIERNT
jgi:hypothetical protein